MSMLFYSASAEKKIATYLDQYAKIVLEGDGGNSYKRTMLNDMAHIALRQIMLDNDETTGYSALKAEIKREQEA